MDKIELLIFDRMSFQALGHFKRGSAGKIDQKIYISFSIPVLGTENSCACCVFLWPLGMLYRQQIEIKFLNK